MKIATLLFLLGAAGLTANTLIGRDHAAMDKAQTTYFANGQLESSVEYESGKKQGAATRWYANGSKVSDGRFEDGRMEGDWQFWNKDGSPDIERTGRYHFGEKVVE